MSVSMRELALPPFHPPPSEAGGAHEGALAGARRRSEPAMLLALRPAGLCGPRMQGSPVTSPPSLGRDPGPRPRGPRGSGGSSECERSLPSSVSVLSPGPWKPFGAGELLRVPVPGAGDSFGRGRGSRPGACVPSGFYGCIAFVSCLVSFDKPLSLSPYTRAPVRFRLLCVSVRPARGGRDTLPN